MMWVRHLARNAMLSKCSCTVRASLTRSKLTTQPRALVIDTKQEIHTSCVSSDSKRVEKPAELDNYPGKEYTYEWQIPIKGKIYDKRPFKFQCKKGEVYNWCACGLSKSQPFCDGSHNGPLLRSVLKPVKFIAPESKEYWFCNCKQTNHRPLCDGSHRDQKVQDAVKS